MFKFGCVLVIENIEIKLMWNICSNCNSGLYESLQTSTFHIYKTSHTSSKVLGNCQEAALLSSQSPHSQWLRSGGMTVSFSHKQHWWQLVMVPDGAPLRSWGPMNLTIVAPNAVQPSKHDAWRYCFLYFCSVVSELLVYCVLFNSSL